MSGADRFKELVQIIKNPDTRQFLACFVGGAIGVGVLHASGITTEVANATHWPFVQIAENGTNPLISTTLMNWSKETCAVSMDFLGFVPGYGITRDILERRRLMRGG